MKWCRRRGIWVCMYVCMHACMHAWVRERKREGSAWIEKNMYILLDLFIVVALSCSPVYMILPCGQYTGLVHYLPPTNRKQVFSKNWFFVSLPTHHLFFYFSHCNFCMQPYLWVPPPHNSYIQNVVVHLIK